MKQSNIALLLMRIGMGLFFLVFGLLKFVQQARMTTGVYPAYWGGAAIPALITILGVVQIIASVLLIVGLFTRISAWIFSVMQLGTVFVTFSRIIAPFTFPDGGAPFFLFFASVPVLFSLIALALLGPGDLSIDARRSGA